MAEIPRKNEEWRTVGTKEVIVACIEKAMMECSNYYTTKYTELKKVRDWARTELPDHKAHD